MKRVARASCNMPADVSDVEGVERFEEAIGVKNAYRAARDATSSILSRTNWQIKRRTGPVWKVRDVQSLRTMITLNYFVWIDNIR